MGHCKKRSFLLYFSDFFLIDGTHWAQINCAFKKKVSQTPCNRFWALWKSTRLNFRPLCIAFHSEKLTFLLYLLRIFLSVGFLKGSKRLHVQEGSMAYNFQQICTLRKSIRPNFRPLCIAFHSEKLTFLLHLLRIFLSVGFLKGSNWLRV